MENKISYKSISNNYLGWCNNKRCIHSHNRCIRFKMEHAIFISILQSEVKIGARNKTDFNLVAALNNIRRSKISCME